MNTTHRLFFLNLCLFTMQTLFCAGAGAGAGSRELARLEHWGKPPAHFMRHPAPRVNEYAPVDFLLRHTVKPKRSEDSANKPQKNALEVAVAAHKNSTPFKKQKPSRRLEKTDRSYREHEGHVVSKATMRQYKLLSQEITMKAKEEIQRLQKENGIPAKTCPWEGCRKAFKTGGVVEHYLSHQNQRLFACQACPAKFNLLKQLKQGSCALNVNKYRAGENAAGAGATDKGEDEEADDEATESEDDSQSADNQKSGAGAGRRH